MTSPLRVAAAGVCCSVGNSRAAASAAIRGELNHFRPGDFADAAGQPVSLAALYQVSVWGQARLQHMYRVAMSECLAALQIPESQPLPPTILIGAERERGPRFQRDLARLLTDNRPEDDHDPRTVLGCVGKAGIAPALVAANQIFASATPPDYVVIVGVDSLLDGASVMHFLEQDRILCSTNSDGFTPGEAAAAIALTPRPTSESALWIEGKGVARHLDRMTHNHGSQPGNTPPFPYLARAWREDDKCKDDRERVKTECNPDGKLTEKHCQHLKVKARGLDGKTAYTEMDNIRTRVQEKLDARENLASFKELSETFEKPKKSEKISEETLANDKKRRKIRKAQTLTAEGQGMLAALPPCLSARKCTLVPYQSQRDNAETAKVTKTEQTLGCCEGQTGHHLIPEAMVNDGSCPAYNHNEAPTACVEGVNHSQGTHGVIHNKMDEVVGRIVTQEYLKVNGKKKHLNADGTMDLDLTVEAAAISHVESFPKSGCSKECIKAQINEYYEKACGSTTRFAAVKKGGQPHKPLDGDQVFV